VAGCQGTVQLDTLPPLASAGAQRVLNLTPASGANVRITVSNWDLPPLHASLQCGHGAVSSWGRSWGDLRSLQPAARYSSGLRNRTASQRRQPRREAPCSGRGVGRAVGYSRATPPHRSAPTPTALSNQSHVVVPIRGAVHRKDAVRTPNGASQTWDNTVPPSVRAPSFRRSREISKLTV